MLSLILAVALSVTIQAPPSASPTEDVGARARSAVAAMAAREFATVEAQFTDRMLTAMPAGRLEVWWTTLLAQAGAHHDCSPTVRQEDAAPMRNVFVTCRFERAPMELRVAFNPAGKIGGLSFRPAALRPVPYTVPAYANPSAYTEEDLTVGSAWPLPATLTLPSGAGPFPAVVLVHGSGPSDRDGTVGPNRPLKDLALGLGSRGIAVLRYDKRTNVHGAKLARLPSMTVKDEVIDDVSEAVTALRAHAKIDRARVFVLGHSLGGMLIPRIAAANPSLAGVVVLAGAARPLEDALLEQNEYLAMVDGVIAADEQLAIEKAEKAAADVKALSSADIASDRRIWGISVPYWLDLRGYDPPAAAAALETPFLILQGERDYQVTMTDYASWRRALGTRPGVTFRSYPALNHRFASGTGRSVPAEYLVASPVAEDVIRDIAAWIKR